MNKLLTPKQMEKMCWDTWVRACKKEKIDPFKAAKKLKESGFRVG